MQARNSVCAGNSLQGVSRASQDEKSGNALLLPTVSVPEDLKKLGIHNYYRDRSSSHYKCNTRREQRTKKTMERSRFYRDLAEAEKREELVRNYWHNKVYEGFSRARRLVQKALLNKK